MFGYRDIPPLKQTPDEVVEERNSIYWQVDGTPSPPT